MQCLLRSCLEQMSPLIDIEGWTERVGAAQPEETECVELISKRQVCKNGVQRSISALNTKRELEEVLLSGGALLPMACVPAFQHKARRWEGTGNFQYKFYLISRHAGDRTFVHTKHMVL